MRACGRDHLVGSESGQWVPRPACPEIRKAVLCGVGLDSTPTTLLPGKPPLCLLIPNPYSVLQNKKGAPLSSGRPVMQKGT